VSRVNFGNFSSCHEVSILGCATHYNRFLGVGRKNCQNLLVYSRLYNNNYNCQINNCYSNFWTLPKSVKKNGLVQNYTNII
jgi:hypothetical protein